jgi:SAM-dependent methyltransferase
MRSAVPKVKGRRARAGGLGALGAAEAEVPPVTRFYEWECERFLDEQRRDVHWYRRLAEEAGGPVLELACGAGRVAVALAADGYEVVGLDLAPYLLGRAAEHARRRGVLGRCTFVHGDMRAFDLGRRFPLVLLPYNSLGYLLTEDEVRSCLGAVAAHLGPGGLFALQITPFEVHEPGRPRAFLASGPWEDGRLEMYERAEAEPERHLTHYDEEYHLRRPGHPPLLYRQRLTLRSWYRADLEALLAERGFRLRAVWGDFDGRPHPLPGQPGGRVLLEAFGPG